MFFSFALYSRLESGLSMEKVFASIYLSTSAVALVGITYKLLGIITFDGRLSAFFLSPNHLAMQLASGFFFGLYFLKKASLQEKSLIKTTTNLLLLILIVIALYYTYSYGAWISTLLSVFVLFFTLPISKKYFLAFLFLCLTFMALFISQLNTAKLASLVDFSSRSSLSSRETIWQVSTILIKQNPIVGIGPGNFQSAYLSLQPMFPLYLEWAVPQPHNIFLAFWLQAGLLGIIGFFVLLFFVFKSFWQLLKHKKNVAFATPLLGFFLYTVLHGLVDTTYWKNDLSFLFWICLILLLFLRKSLRIN
jgi:O-antigen ligase